MSENITSSKREIILNKFNSILETIPVEGKNKVIVAHSFPVGVGLGEIPYMGTVIIKSKGEGKGYEIVHRVSLEDGSKLNSFS